MNNTPYTTAEQLATRHSLSLALDMPFKKLSAPGTSNQGRTSLNPPSKNQVQRTTSEALTAQPNSIPPQHPSPQPLSSASSAKSRVVHEKPVPRVNSTPSPDVKAIALAAGARIISPSSASQLKVAQVRNVVPSTSTTSAKTSTLAGVPSEFKVQSSTSSGGAAVPSQAAVPSTSLAPCTNVRKAFTTPSTLSEQNKNVTTSVVNEVAVKQEVNACPAPKESVPNTEKLDQDKSTNIPVKEGTGPPTESIRIVEAVETNNQQIASGSNVDKGSQDSNKEKSKDAISGSSEIKP